MLGAFSKKSPSLLCCGTDETLSVPTVVSEGGQEVQPLWLHILQDPGIPGWGKARNQPHEGSAAAPELVHWGRASSLLLAETCNCRRDWKALRGPPGPGGLVRSHFPSCTCLLRIQHLSA